MCHKLRFHGTKDNLIFETPQKRNFRSRGLHTRFWQKKKKKKEHFTTVAHRPKRLSHRDRKSRRNNNSGWNRMAINFHGQREESTTLKPCLDDDNFALVEDTSRLTRCRMKSSIFRWLRTRKSERDPGKYINLEIDSEENGLVPVSRDTLWDHRWGIFREGNYEMLRKF